MIRDTMYIDPDTITRMIYGMNDLLNGLNHADFITGLNDALKDSEKRHDFMERDYNILLGSIEFMSGAVQILADGLMNGDLDIVASEPYSGAELDRMRKYTADILHRVDDVEVMRKIYTFTKTLIEG